MKRNGGRIWDQAQESTNNTGTTGIFDLHDQHYFRQQDQWRQGRSFVSASVSPTSAAESSTFTLTVTTLDYLDGEYINWDIVHGTTSAADFGSTSGTITITNNSGVLSIVPNAADGTDTPETFQIRLRDPYSGNATLFTSGTLTINADSVGNLFPVSGADVQWEFWAEEAPSSWSAGTYYQVPSPFIGYTLSEDRWKSDFAATRYSYTNSSGSTAYYMEFSADSDVTTQTNTSDGPTCISNGGYTLWFGWRPFWSGTAWGRAFNYWGFASGSATFNSAQPTSTSQYHGPLIFVNASRTDIQYRRPSPTTSNGDYAYSVSGSATENSGYINIFVISQYTNGTANYRAWNGSRLSGSGTYYGQNSFSFSGSAGTGFKNSVNAARPFFADATYSGTAVSPLQLHTAGFINQPLSSTDQLTLLNYIKNKYA